MTLTITSHALSRYRSRVAPVTADEADKALRSPAIEQAAQFGAPYVRLPGGQRVVLNGFVVVTVLPADCPAWRLGTRHA